METPERPEKPQAIQERENRRAEAKERAKSRIMRQVGRTEPYIQRVEGYITEVRCKCCGHAVANLKELPSTLEKYWADRNTMVVKKGMVLKTLPNHRRIRIFFDDGSDHETEVCRDCLNGLSTNDLESIYCCDMLQFLDDESHGDDEAPWHILADRTPVNFEIASQ